LPGKNEVYTDQNWNDRDGNVIAFGHDATDKYTHTDDKGLLFFERFKMALYEQKMDKHNIDEKQTEIINESELDYRTDISQFLSATNGKQLPSRKVLEEAIRFMKNHAMNNLRSKVNKNLKTQNVQWILTVPAIWSNKAKSVMQTAAINAGMIDPLIDRHLIIAYEPDCASLSIQFEINKQARTQYKLEQRMKKEQLSAAQNIQESKHEMMDSDDEFQNFFERGDKMLLCDLELSIRFGIICLTKSWIASFRIVKCCWICLR